MGHTVWALGHRPVDEGGIVWSRWVILLHLRPLSQLNGFVSNQSVKDLDILNSYPLRWRFRSTSIILRLGTFCQHGKFGVELIENRRCEEQICVEDELHYSPLRNHFQVLLCEIWQLCYSFALGRIFGQISCFWRDPFPDIWISKC